MPQQSSNAQDLGIYKTQIVQVFKSDGTFIDVWRDAPLLAGIKFSLNSATSPITVELPRAFDDFDLPFSKTGAKGSIAQGNIVKYSMVGPTAPGAGAPDLTYGYLKFQGVIDSYSPQIKEDGSETVSVVITPLDSVLADHFITGSIPIGTADAPVDPLTMFQYFDTTDDPNLAGVSGLASKKYLAPVTYDYGNNPASSGILSYFTFQNQALLSAFQGILLFLPQNWFFYVSYTISATPVLEVNVSPITSQHDLYVGQHITAPTYSQDWSNVQNIIYFTGGTTNTGATAFGLAIGTDLPQLGVRYGTAQDSRADSNSQCQILAQGLLQQNDRVILRSKVRVLDYRGDSNTGIGYDIESFKLGDTVRIIDPESEFPASQWDFAKWDVDKWDVGGGTGLNTVCIIQTIDYNFDYVDLELGTPQPNIAGALNLLRQKFSDFSIF